MIEKLIILEDIDPVIFYGVNNANIQLIKALYPKLRIVARGNVIKVLGDEEEMCAFEENITKLEKYCAEYNSLKEEVIIDIIKGNAPQAEQNGNVIVFSVTGKPIIPRISVTALPQTPTRQFSPIHMNPCRSSSSWRKTECPQACKKSSRS